MKTYALPRRAASIWQLMLNELYKFWRCPLVWSLFALNVGVVLVGWLAMMYTAARTPGSFAPGHSLGMPDGIGDAVGQPMGLGRRAGEFIAVALGALTFGGEFSSGSIRFIFTRGMGRTAFLVAKYLALAVVGGVLVLVGMVTSSLFSNALILLNPDAPTLLQLNGTSVSILAMLFLGTLENYLFCLLLGATLGIMSRSTAIGLVAGCGWLIGENLLARWLQMMGASLHSRVGLQIVALLLTPNLEAFYRDSLPPQLAAMPDPLSGMVACNPTATACQPSGAGQALLVCLIWALVLSGVSIFLVARRDVLQ